MDSVRLVRRSADGIDVASGGDEIYDRVVETLGLAPDRRAKVAFYVEGPNDVEFLYQISRLHRSVDLTLPDLENDHRIAFVVAGGGNLKHWVDRRYLANAKLTEVHLYDSDDPAEPKYKPQFDAVNGRRNNDIAFLTNKRELENYIHPDAIAAALTCRVNVTDWCDVPDLVAEQIYLAGGGQTRWQDMDEEKKGKKVNRAKQRLNFEAVAQMTLAQLQQMDTNHEIRNWLCAIRDRCE